MADRNKLDLIRINELDPGDNTFDIENEGNVLPVDNPQDRTLKIKTKTFLSQIINFAKTHISRILPDSVANKYLGTNENNEVVWKDVPEQVNADWDAAEGKAKILNKPTFAQVATSGNYDDLNRKPDLSVYAESASLAPVATSGSYNDLSNKPTIPTLVNPNWNESDPSSKTYIENKPTDLDDFTNNGVDPYVKASDIADKADRSELPSVPTNVSAFNNDAGYLTSQDQADWTESDVDSPSYIAHKPVNLVQDASYVHTDNNFTGTLKDKLDNIEAGAQVNVKPDWTAAAGSAAEILNKPSIPAGQVNADWNASSGVEKILHKPGVDSTLREYTDGQDNKLWGVKNPLPSSIGNAGDVLTVNNGAPVWMPPAPQGQTPIIYLDRSSGNDSNDGLSSTKPVATFAKALSILKYNKGATIYALTGGDYTLNGADALGILSLDGASNKVLVMDFTLFCEGYLDLNFSDTTASISLVKLNGNIKIQSYSQVLIKNLDVTGYSFDVESGSYITINESYTNNISSMFVNIKAFANIYAKNANIQCNRENSEVKFHTVRGVVIDLRDADITCYRLAVTSDSIGYTDLTGTGGYTAGTEVYFSYNNGNHAINVTGECLVRCWKLQTHKDSAITCGRFNLTCETGYIPKIDSYSDVNIHSTRNIEIQNQIAITSYGHGNYANINITSEAGEVYFYNNDAANEYILGAERIKITAGSISYSDSRQAVPPINGKIVLINTYSGNGSTYLPDIIGQKVIIKSESNVEINNIFPANAAANRTVHITCENLKFKSSSKKIGTKTYGSSIRYFDFLDIRARRFDIANGGNEILAYAIYIKTTGIDKNASYGDLQIDIGAYVSAMVLKIDCTSLDIGSSGFICVGANSNANPKVADLDWTSNDINTETRYSADIHAATYHAASPFSKLLCLCPYGNQKSGQFAHIDIGVIDYGSTTGGGAYIIPVVFHGYNGSGNTPNTFNGDLAGRIGGIYIDGQLRLYPWDNFTMLGFVNSAAVGQTASINLPLDNNGNIQGTGKITASFDHSLYREFYVFPAPGAPTSLDLNDGLSSATAVGTMTGLLRSMSKTEISAYPIIIHILGGTGTTFVLDLEKVIKYNTTAYGPVTMFDIQGNANIDTVVTNIPSGVSVLSVHDFRNVILSPSRVTSNGVSMRNGCIFAYNISGRIEYANIDCETSAIWHSILNLESCEDMRITGIAANTVRAKCGGTLEFNNSRWSSGCDIVLESKFYTRFNTSAMNAPVVDETYSGVAVEIIGDTVEANLSKFRMTGCSVRIKATNMATATLSARRGFYGGNGISVDAETTYIESVISTEEALPDPIAPSGLSVSSDAIHLTSKNNDGEATALPFFHCSFVATKEIVLDCRKFSIDYGFKRLSAISASILGNVYNEASFISAPEIKPFYPNFSVEVPDTYVDNSAIEFINSNVIVNTGILDTELRFSTAGLFSDETNKKMREINATLNIGRITKHGKISGYNIYDSSYANPINFNLISSIGMVERDSTAWYAYYNDGTSGQADNDPAKHTNFKFIAHVMHEGSSSVTQSYTGANTLWQVVCDDKPQNNLPAAPSSNGSYILTCTMNNGTPSYSWITMNTTTV